MTRAELDDEMRGLASRWWQQAAASIEARYSGRRGASAARERILAAVERITALRRGVWVREYPETRASSHAKRLGEWLRASALRLAEAAGQNYDEHGPRGGTTSPGDYRRTDALDFVPPRESEAAPYCDMGGEGMGLVCVTRTRVYSGSAQCRPSKACDTFLVGRNECGTYYAHPVPSACNSVHKAVDWIWDGHANDILARQGDIALIRGRGPKLPPHLPHGHVIEGGVIVHATHPDIRMPGSGERIIVGRRAVERASAATRD